MFRSTRLFYLHNISTRERAACGFTFQIEKTRWWQQSVNFIKASLTKHRRNLTMFKVFQVTLVSFFVFLAVRNFLVIIKT